MLETDYWEPELEQDALQAAMQRAWESLLSVPADTERYQLSRQYQEQREQARDEERRRESFLKIW